MKIKSVTINEFNGGFQQKIYLNEYLNIISGENGTGKTIFLQKIKQQSSLELFEENPGVNIGQKIFALNPKRNSQRRDLEQIIIQYRRDNKNYEKFLTESIQKQFNTGGFDNYPSFLELFMLYFEKLDNIGGNRIEAMSSVAKEFNDVISRIFDNYEVAAKWNDNKGRPEPTIKKKNIEIPATSLSCGEDEVFSLILNLYSTKDKFDIYLIDEPEVHLNWHLEERLFHYLEQFSKEYNKQLIVATHSRIVFRDELKDYVQYFYWNEEKIQVSKSIPGYVKEKLIGEGINQLKLGNFSKVTFFVEDSAHEIYLYSLASIFNKDILITKCSTSSNVKSLFILSKNEGGWANTYFIIDNDNQGNPFSMENNFIQLSSYCIENYGLNIEITSKVFNKSCDDIREKIFDIIKNSRDKILKNNKYLDFLFDRLQLTDINETKLSRLDGSEIFTHFIDYLNVNRNDFWQRMFQHCLSNNELDKIVEKKLLSVIKNA